MNNIEFLKNTKPVWATIDSATANQINLHAYAPLKSGAQGRLYHLTIKIGSGSGPTVSESGLANLLPQCCIERHINPDASFCLSQGSTSRLTSLEDAHLWWRSLGYYLAHQDFAAKRRFWPLEAGLSHGDAADIQLKMEALAEVNGWKQDVQAAALWSEGWLGGALPRLSKNKRTLVNARSNCPRGCTWKHKALRSTSCETTTCQTGCRKQHKRIVRSDCPNRDIVEELVLLEHQRREAEREVIDILIKGGIACCGTMDHCQLRNALSDKTS